MEPIHPTLSRPDLKYWLLRPDARLQPAVRCYFVVDATSASPGGPPEAPSRGELLLPDGYSEIVFNLDAGYERWKLGESSSRSVMKRSYLIGGRSGSVMTSGLGHLKLVGVKLDPRLLRWIIGTPLVEFRDSTLDLVDLNHKPLLVLEDALAAATSVRHRVSALDAFFLRQFETYTQQDRLLATLLKAIHSTRGVLAITRWVREHGIDPRTLERRFSAWIGMGPKRYARIVRFRHSYHALINDQWRRTPAGAEYLDGYYDQSHFNREFRYFTGTSPSLLMADRSRSSTQVTNHLLKGDYSPAALTRR